MTTEPRLENEHLAVSPFPKVFVEKLPESILNLLFTELDPTTSECGLVSEYCFVSGMKVRLSNSYVLRQLTPTTFDKFDEPSPWTHSSSPTFCKPWAQVPHADDVDSGIDGCTPIQSSKRDFIRSSPMEIDEKFNYHIRADSDDDISKRPPKWKAADEKGEYEVQKVLEHKFSPDGHDLFFIKWSGWGSQFNTWEPVKNLHCEEHLISFLMKRILYNPFKSLPHSGKLLIRSCRAAIEHWSKNTGAGALNKMVLKGGINQKPLPMTVLVDKLLLALKERNLQKREAIMEVIRENCVLMHLQAKRKDQLARLKEWESKVNAYGGSPLTVENNVDLEGPPENFSFIKSYVPGPGGNAALTEGQVAGCDCGEKCGPGKSSCCPGMAGAEFAYSRNRLRLRTGDAIFECNRFCSCGIDCQNRIVQRGRKVKMCIFRTDNGRGWGVKSLENVKAGTFLTTYLGELIGTEEAERRDEEYVRTGVSYLFDLDYLDDNEQTKYCVDALRAGNESHFINHSCDPNAHVLGVWIETCDPSLPILALFAKKDIMKGEEITFSYKGNRTDGSHEGSNRKMKKRKRNGKCKCGALNCEGDLFFIS